MKESDFLLYPEVWKDAGVKVYPFVVNSEYLVALLLNNSRKYGYIHFAAL